MWEKLSRNWTSFLYLPERHMTGSDSWTKLSLNSTSEGDGGVKRGVVRTGPASSEATSMGFASRTNRKQSHRARTSAFWDGHPQPLHQSALNSGGWPIGPPSYFKLQFRTYFSEKRRNFSPNTFCLRKTITAKFELRRERKHG